MNNLVWFYCENCFNTEVKNMAKFREAAESLSGFAWNRDGMFSNLHGLICPHCGCKHSTYSVDFGMIPVIRLLHEKGYITKACCSGHKESTCFHSKSDEAYFFLEHSETLGRYLTDTKKIVFGDIHTLVDYTVEIEYGDGVEKMDGICVRARFKDSVEEKEKNINLLAISLFVFASIFPDNADENCMVKYSYVYPDGDSYKPYTDKKEEE